MEFKLYIDTREATLQDVLKKNNQDFIVQPMELGDIQISDGTNTIIFERKTISDLSSSIRDGRYKEQKVRIKSFLGNNTHRCTYILEECQFFKNKCMNDDVFYGVIINTMYRDGIHVMFSNNIEETARIIIITYNKIMKDPSKFFQQSDQPASYLECVKVKTKKIDNIDKDTCYLLQLCQIPGISHKIAQEIQKIYPDMRSFMSFISSDIPQEDKVKQLCKIPMIAQKKALAILNYI